MSARLEAGHAFVATIRTNLPRSSVSRRGAGDRERRGASSASSAAPGRGDGDRPPACHASSCAASLAAPFQSVVSLRGYAEKDGERVRRGRRGGVVGGRDDSRWCKLMSRLLTISDSEQREKGGARRNDRYGSEWNVGSHRDAKASDETRKGAGSGLLFVFKGEGIRRGKDAVVSEAEKSFTDPASTSLRRKGTCACVCLCVPVCDVCVRLRGNRSRRPGRFCHNRLMRNGNGAEANAFGGHSGPHPESD